MYKADFIRNLNGVIAHLEGTIPNKSISFANRGTFATFDVYALAVYIRTSIERSPLRTDLSNTAKVREFKMPGGQAAEMWNMMKTFINPDFPLTDKDFKKIDGRPFIEMSVESARKLLSWLDQFQDYLMGNILGISAIPSSRAMISKKDAFVSQRYSNKTGGIDLTSLKTLAIQKQWSGDQFSYRPCTIAGTARRPWIYADYHQYPALA